MRLREGYTLVEVLIVIIIIAILAGLIAVGLGGTQENADAQRVIESLRTIKSAYIAYYADNRAFPPLTSGSGVSSDIVTSLDRYIGSGVQLPTEVDMYGDLIIQEGSANQVYIGFMGGSIRGGSTPQRIYAALLERADAMELKGENGGPLVADGPILMRVR